MRAGVGGGPAAESVRVGIDGALAGVTGRLRWIEDRPYGGAMTLQVDDRHTERVVLARRMADLDCLPHPRWRGP